MSGLGTWRTRGSALLLVWMTLQRLALLVIMVGAMCVVVGDAVVSLWERGSHLLSVLSAIVFPATWIIWPWRHETRGIHLWILFVAGSIAFAILNHDEKAP